MATQYETDRKRRREVRTAVIKKSQREYTQKHFGKKPLPFSTVNRTPEEPQKELSILLDDVADRIQFLCQTEIDFSDIYPLTIFYEQSADALLLDLDKISSLTDQFQNLLSDTPYGNLAARVRLVATSLKPHLENIENSILAVICRAKGVECPSHFFTDDFEKMAAEHCNDLKYLAVAVRTTMELPAATDIRRETSGWPKLIETAKILGFAKSYVSRLVKNGKLKDNGQARKLRRIDPASILKFQQIKTIAADSAAAPVVTKKAALIFHCPACPWEGMLGSQEYRCPKCGKEARCGEKPKIRVH